MIIEHATVTVRLDDGTKRTYEANETEIRAHLDGNPFLNGIVQRAVSTFVCHARLKGADRGIGVGSGLEQGGPR